MNSVNTQEELSGPTKQYSFTGGVIMTYFVGIDIAKFKHDCFIMNHEGEVIRSSFTFKNDKTGFNELLSVLSSLDSNQTIKIGLEATGHYATNLKIFLEENNFSYMEFNPILVKRFSQATTLRRTKTDKKDARLISLYLSTVDYKTYPSKSYHIQNLKSLTRSRECLVKERSKQLIRITNVLDLIFPEFKPFFNKKLNSSTCLYILDHYTVPSKIANMNIDSFHKMTSKLRRTLSYARFLELKQLAKNTVGNEDPILAFELRTYLDLYKHYVEKINEIESLIQSEMKNIHTNIHTIPGIGIISAASIYSEIGNIARFNTWNQLVAFAGIDPSKNESGESAHNGHMVKHGSSYLRQTIMNVAESSLLHNPVLYEYYLKKRNEGKAHRVSLSHVAKRLLRIIFYLEKNNKSFDMNKMR